jgi:fibro-slime domain-containing protein
MFKKSQFPVFVPRVLALAFVALVSSVFADKKALDVILRDFPVDYYGFEQFDSDRNLDGVCAGSNPSKPNTQVKGKPGNGICVNSSNDYIPCGGTLSGSKNNGDACNSETDRDCIWSYPGQLLYGEYEDCTVNVPGIGSPKKRGYKSGPDVETGCAAKRAPWANPVFVTKGMVQDRLDYGQCPADERGEPGSVDEALKGRYCARPKPANGACYGDNLDMWFTDGGHTRTFRDLMELEQVGTSKTYKIQYDYNTYVDWGSGYDNGYFPLDKMEGSFGKQSLNMWCGNHYPDDGQNGKYNCGQYIGAAYWKKPETAQAAMSANNIPARKLHNYGFTMAGSAEFKYDDKAEDVFEFIGDDDMWIFIDGNLAVDLGGTHLAAPAKINIKNYGNEKGWADGSMHAINFFYADRQTDGSNMMIKLAITNLTDAQFGAPYIKRAETNIRDEGTETILYVSSQLMMSSIEEFRNNIDHGFPIVVYSLSDKRIYGYKLESITPGPKTNDGYTYIVTGEMCLDPRCDNTKALSSGDSLSFNIIRDDDWPSYADPGFALSDESKYIKNTSGRESTAFGNPGDKNKWGPNATLRTIEIAINTPDTKPIKPPFEAINPENSGAGGKPAREDPNVPGGSGGPVGGFDPQGRGQLDNITQVWNPKANNGNGGMENVPPENRDVHGFGTIGAQIPPQRAGELILTAFPNSASAPTGFASYEDWYTAFKEGKIDGNADLFGLPPEAGEGWWGLVDPTVQATGGGYQFIKNGFPNESNTKGSIKVSPTRCTAEIKWEEEPGKRASINCLNFNMVAQQPFQLAVTVYDQLGNFVTQYRETISEQDFRNVTQAPNYLAENSGTLKEAAGCELPRPDNYGKKTTTTTNGFINVNVNIYPFSTTGRRFGNGVYIAKVDRVDLPFTGCQLNEGVANPASPLFKRVHSEQKFGWMRAKSK